MNNQDVVETPNVRQLRPEGHQSDADSARRARHRIRHRSAGLRSSERRIQALTLALIIAILSIIVVVIGSAIYLRGVTDSNAAIDQQARRMQRELADATAKAQALEAQRDALVAGRIPGLRRLEFDQTIDIAEKYVRNISFTMTSAPTGATAYEFRLVLSNDTLKTITPDVRVATFNELGIQNGLWDIAAKDAMATTVISPTMDPGEVRSYTATVERLNNEPPVYFQIFLD